MLASFTFQTAEQDYDVAGVVARSPEKVVLMSADRFRQSILRSEEINCSSLSIIAAEDRRALLPQYYADEFPWPGMVAKVADVYYSLTPEEQQRAAIFGSNYGQAAAIDFFGAQYGLPNAISGHQNYFLWGPRQYTGDIVILLGGLEDEARQQFESVTVAGTLNNPYAYRYENRPILLCRGLKWNLQADWARVKKWR